VQPTHDQDSRTSYKHSIDAFSASAFARRLMRDLSAISQTVMINCHVLI
jgi:hypothetical protein